MWTGREGTESRDVRMNVLFFLDYASETVRSTTFTRVDPVKFGDRHIVGQVF